MDLTFFIFLIFLLAGAIHLLFVFAIFCIDENEIIDKKDSEKLNWPLLTILICARDEAENLKQHIPFICEQDYENLQVIVVNHQSIDETPSVLQTLKEKYVNLDVVYCQVDDPTLPGKRSALNAGIKEARGEYILLTDADCKPSSPQWASIMTQRAVMENHDIVLGVGAYEKKKSWLNRFIQFETFHTANLYIAAAIMGRPYMGVGRNMLIKKDLLESQLKKSVVPGVNSGDDDLLLTHVSFSHQMAVEFHSMAHTISKPKIDWASYFHQKSRHVSTADFYRPSTKWILIGYHMSLTIFLLALIILLFSRYVAPALILYVMRTILVCFWHYKNQRILALRQNLLLIPAMEFLLIFVPGLSILKNLLNKSNEW